MEQRDLLLSAMHCDRRWHMTFRCKLYDVEEKMADIESNEPIPDDIAELEDDDMILVVSGWCCKIEELGICLRAGCACVWDEEEQVYMPDFSVTVIYEDENELNHYLYFEQDDFITTMHNWLHGRLTDDEISELMCEVEYETERED